MDDFVAALTATVAAYRRLKQIIKSIYQLALVLGLLDEEDAIVSREYIYSLRNVHRTAVTSSVKTRCCWRPLKWLIKFSRKLMSKLQAVVTR